MSPISKRATFMEMVQTLNCYLQLILEGDGQGIKLAGNPDTPKTIRGIPMGVISTIEPLFKKAGINGSYRNDIQLYTFDSNSISVEKLQLLDKLLNEKLLQAIAGRCAAELGEATKETSGNPYTALAHFVDRLDPTVFGQDVIGQLKATVGPATESDIGHASAAAVSRTP